MSMPLEIAIDEIPNPDKLGCIFGLLPPVARMWLAENFLYKRLGSVGNIYYSEEEAAPVLEASKPVYDKKYPDGTRVELRIKPIDETLDY